ncbi:MAG: 4Fe-4S dicluster domain-containing protein, partial [Desulfamplus sp.]|nr:4Fe-4S dicluster domain-containing protein [Desulfamplus sp.]
FRFQTPETVALLPSRIPFVKVGLLVHEGDSVSIGTPLYQDKRDTRIRFLSPGGGVVEKIIFGQRRVVEEIVIRLDRQTEEKTLNEEETSRHFNDDFLPFIDGTSTLGAVESLSRHKLIDLLMMAGMWYMFRQFPFMDIADDKNPFPMIIVSLQQGDMFSPSAGAILENREDFFLCGLSVIKKLADNVVVAAPESFNSKTIEKQITHITCDRYPCGDPGVILYKIRENTDQNRSVTVHPQDVIAIGEFFSTGRFPLYRIYTVAGSLGSVAGSAEKKPCHVMARVGCPVTLLTGEIPPGHAVLTGGVFTGSAVSLPGDSSDALTETDKTLKSFSPHMGTQEYSAIVIRQSSQDRMFGFLVPGFESVTESRTFISSFIRGRAGQRSVMDASLSDDSVPGLLNYSNDSGLLTDMNLHGEKRPCINCGLCDKKCPVDLLPQFIMKAAMADEMEEVIGMGLLDCTLCGLCSFVCPSKIDLKAIMDSAKKVCYKDRGTI